MASKATKHLKKGSSCGGAVLKFMCLVQFFVPSGCSDQWVGIVGAQHSAFLYVLVGHHSRNHSKSELIFRYFSNQEIHHHFKMVISEFTHLGESMTVRMVLGS